MRPLTEKPITSIVVGDVILKSAALMAAGVFLLRAGNNYTACYPDANALDTLPTYVLSLALFGLTARILLMNLAVPPLERLIRPGWIRFLTYVAFVYFLITLASSVFVVTSETLGLEPKGRECNGVVKSWPFPISN